MKLLHVIASMDPQFGGPCQGIRNLNTNDAKLGIHREVVSMDDPNAAFLRKDNFIIHPLGPAKNPWMYTPKLFPWLITNIQRFDAIIVNGIWIYHTYAVRKAIRKLNVQKKKTTTSFFPIPLVFIMPHGMLDPYFQNAKDRKLKALRNRIYWKWIEEKNIRNADGLLFTCKSELELAKTTFSPYRPKKELNVSYGVEATTSFNEAMEASFRKKCPNLKHAYFLFLGRIHQKKGVDMLIHAYILLFQSLSREKKNELQKLVIAGPGLETTYGQKLKKLLATVPEVAPSIFFTGMLTDDAKRGALWGCEAFILPSHQENFGIAVAEALSCSKPVLISDKINIYTEIQQANAGFVANDTVKGTLELLTRWFNSTAADKVKMQKNAATCFINNFSIEKAAKNLFNILESQLQGHAC